MLEKCIFKYLYNYLVDYNKITSVQSGFRPKDSAVFQLIDLYDTFCRAFDDGKEVRVVFVTSARLLTGCGIEVFNSSWDGWVLLDHYFSGFKAILKTGIRELQ